MSSIVQLGDVPGWAQTVLSAALLYLSLSNRWQAQAVEWAQELEELSGMTTEQLTASA